MYRNMTFADKVVIAIVIGISIISMLSMNILLENDIGEIVVIEVDGKLYGKYDLNTVKFPMIIEINTVYGYNKVEILEEGIRMSESSCPDKICLNSGVINDANEMIVCLPNRIVVRLERNSTEIDGVAY